MSGDLQAPEMCRDVAPGHISGGPLGSGGLRRSIWCHLDKGHDGPHACGPHRWEWPMIPSCVSPQDWAVLVEVNGQIRAARALRKQILAKYGLDAEEEP